jgi:1-acyl-sn-glycerol-3-phosphate acyltransferase
MRWLGGVPIDRNARSNVVQQAVERFAALGRLFLLVPPSGTRKRAPHWKSGFYHIARGAGVPIICTFLDYGRRAGGVGLVLVPSGDIVKDMSAIREFYAGVRAKYPELVTPVRLLEEARSSEESHLHAASER